MSERRRTPRPPRRCAPLPTGLFDGLFELVLSLPRREPCSSSPRRLASLFRDLARQEPERDPEELSDLIWAHWIAHRDRTACSTMCAAIEAMDHGAFDLARTILDRLVESQPGWAEAWNKRGTLAFIERRDADALGDIERTLVLEPRHFGAVSGFGQICLRHGRLAEAKAAFQMALAINPHLCGLSEAIDEIGWATRSQFH
ncbi:MAG: tetratricopeptide repeat protein [Alsobacter sp.]